MLFDAINSPASSSLLRRHRCVIVTILWLFLGVTLLPRTRVLAGEIRLKNGITIEGKPVPLQSLIDSVQRNPTEIVSYPIRMIDTGMQRYYVPQRQVMAETRDVLSSYETFSLEQKKVGQQLMVQSVGSFLDMTPFDELGRRTVVLRTPGKPMNVLQGITKIHPKYLTVTGLNCTWEYAIATTSVPAEALDRMIRRVTDQKNPNDRLAIARFYLQAALYPESQRELDAILVEFPELAERVDELTLQVRELVGKRLIDELHQRQTAGQHFLAYTAATQFPTKKVSADLLRQVRELIQSYEEARERIEETRMWLGELQAQLEPHDQQAVKPLRSEVSENLNYQTLGRLDAFRQLKSDDTLSAAEKLALAYSGWIVGSAHAVTELDTAVRMWEARFLVLEYLRSSTDLERQQILARLHNLEGIGFPTILQLVAHISTVCDAHGIEAGQAVSIEIPVSKRVDEEAAPAMRYSVLLPLEYRPHRDYPAIVALHATGQPVDNLLRWWGGTADEPLQSQRRGYVVIAPEYTPATQWDDEHQAAAHESVLQSLRDARQRFRLDSNRVFLAGHGMGADAAFDIGMSHPDEFAGIIAVGGTIDDVCKHYWQNGRSLAWYVVCGERDGETFAANAFQLNRMLKNGFDLILAEYIGRGRETYYEEIHKLFDWMDLHKRPQLPTDIDVNILRSTENRFYWIQLDGLPASITQSPSESDSETRRRTVSRMILEAHIAPGDTDRNVLQIRSGADRHTIWLNPDLIDFEKRVSVRFKGRRQLNDFVRPDMEALLEDLRVRGDRQRLFWTKLELD